MGLSPIGRFLDGRVRTSDFVMPWQHTRMLRGQDTPSHGHSQTTRTPCTCVAPPRSEAGVDRRDGAAGPLDKPGTSCYNRLAAGTCRRLQAVLARIGDWGFTMFHFRTLVAGVGCLLSCVVTATAAETVTVAGVQTIRDDRAVVRENTFDVTFSWTSDRDAFVRLGPAGNQGRSEPVQAWQVDGPSRQASLQQCQGAGTETSQGHGPH